MSYSIQGGSEISSAGRLRMAILYARYDWTREMPKSRRFIAWTGFLIQGYAIYAGLTRSLMWPFMWLDGLLLYSIVLLLYILGSGIVNGMLTSEFFRETQLEADQIAAQQIQQTLRPLKVQQPRGYEVEAFYKPFRDIGGDYFDVIELPNNRILLAVAGVSGKGNAGGSACGEHTST